MADYGAGSAGSAGDAELQEFLMAEKQKAQVQAQVSMTSSHFTSNVTYQQESMQQFKFFSVVYE